MSNTRILVIGGVAAGMSAASQAKRRLPEADVIVFERGNRISYGACGMPYNIGDPSRDIEDLVLIKKVRSTT
jgi:NADPH-dependent 2,4-dienoyl-CoA reductase/sulfur reductase-like enzyme